MQLLLGAGCCNAMQHGMDMDWQLTTAVIYCHTHTLDVNICSRLAVHSAAAELPLHICTWSVLYCCVMAMAQEEDGIFN